jgi:hypothetical protein
MPDPNDIPRRRSRLLLDVTTAASEVSRLVHEAHDLHLPVEPGVRPGRDSLVRWAVLLEEVIPPERGLGSIQPTRCQRPPSPGGAAWRTPRVCGPQTQVSGTQRRSSRSSLPPRRAVPTTAALTP